MGTLSPSPFTSSDPVISGARAEDHLDGARLGPPDWMGGDG
jgi:hypothetical protein